MHIAFFAFVFIQCLFSLSTSPATLVIHAKILTFIFILIAFHYSPWMIMFLENYLQTSNCNETNYSIQ